MTGLYKPWLEGLPEYVPGEAPEVGEEGKLSSNESPFAPSEEIVDAVLEAARRLNRYPDPLATELREDLAGRLGISRSSILVGNGSDEIIHLISLAYLGPGATVVLADPPFLSQEIASRAHGASVVKVPLADYRHDLEGMAEVEAEIAFITNPHNPSGTTVSREELERFLEVSPARLVVADEAYIDFVEDSAGMSALPLAEDGRVVVLRTFSKLHGLAGARVGYAVAAPGIVRALQKIQPPFSVNALGQAAARASLANEESAEQMRRLIQANRSRMSEAFEKAGFYVVPSQANFVLVQAPDEAGLLGRLNEAGLAARPGTALGMPGHIRVSVGTSEAAARLEDALSV